jgi:RNA polymerase sigma-70 factor (ECF subfamily)
VGSVEVAEDITHDCFLSLIRNPVGFNPQRAALRTYLYAAARNLAMKYFRSQGRETNIDDVNDYREIAANQQPLRQILDDELVAKVKEAVANLPPLQRESLVLFEYEGLSLLQIAEIVGTDVGTVKSRLHRARGRLRNSLAPYLNTNPEIVTLEQA